MNEIVDFTELARLVATLDLENSSIDDPEADEVTLVLGGADGKGWHIGGADMDRRDAEILLKLLKAIPELVKAADRFRYIYGHIEYLMRPEFVPASVLHPVVTFPEDDS